VATADEPGDVRPSGRLPPLPGRSRPPGSTREVALRLRFLRRAPRAIRARRAGGWGHPRRAVRGHASRAGWRGRQKPSAPAAVTPGVRGVFDACRFLKRERRADPHLPRSRDGGHARNLRRCLDRSQQQRRRGPPFRKEGQCPERRLAHGESLDVGAGGTRCMAGDLGSRVLHDHGGARADRRRLRTLRGRRLGGGGGECSRTRTGRRCALSPTRATTSRDPNDSCRSSARLVGDCPHAAIAESEPWGALARVSVWRLGSSRKRRSQ
jgi:hypothetical protein